MAEPEFLAEYFKALDPGEPLAPDHQWRVSLHPRAGSLDPIAELRTSIEWASLDSVHLLSGFRGTGKTTELRRLASDLREGGALVIETDMREYLNFEDVVDISHLLLSVAGSFGDALSAPELLGEDPKRESYWQRFKNMLTRTEVELEAIADPSSALGLDLGLKAALRDNPSFRRRLSAHLEASLSAFIKDIHAYMGQCLHALHERYGQDTRVVLILDSIEHLSVDALNHAEVTASFVRVFSTYAKDLRFENLHVVYTVPPWLKVANKGLLGLYDSTTTLPCVKIRGRDGQPDEEGLALLSTIVERRAPRWRELFEEEGQLRRLLLASGGYLRDLFQLLKGCLRAARSRLPLTNDEVELVMAQYSNHYRPISHADAKWLQRIATTHEAELEQLGQLSILASYFDAHLVLCYVNGQEWYDVHPLIADYVRALDAKASSS